MGYSGKRTDKKHNESMDQNILKSLKKFRHFMIDGNVYMIKDRAHEVLSILLVFTSNNILSFTLNYLLLYSATLT